MHSMLFTKGSENGMDTARGIGSRGSVGGQILWLWFLPLCGACVAGVVYAASTILTERAEERQRIEKNIAEASDALAGYIASVASGNPVGKVNEEAFTRINRLGLVDRPKPAVRVGDRSLIFFEGLTGEMCKGLSGRTLGNVESISVNGSPFTEYYDGALCRPTSYRTVRQSNWIAVIRNSAPTP